MKKTNSKSNRRVRYAVVGLGDTAQGAVRPAFANAKSNSELAGLVSDDPKKLRARARRYKVRATCSYEDFEDFLKSDSKNSARLFDRLSGTFPRPRTLKKAVLLISPHRAVKELPTEAWPRPPGPCETGVTDAG